MHRHCACRDAIVAPSRRLVLAGLAAAAVAPRGAHAQAAAPASADDVQFMRMALDEASQADFPFGAVIVRDGSVIARGRFAVAGLTLGFLLWQVGFMSIGGEWFGMWQSQQWNGVPSAFRFLITILAVLIFVAIPDQELERGGAA